MITVIKSFITDDGVNHGSYCEVRNHERFVMGLVKVCSNSKCHTDIPSDGLSCERCGSDGVDPERCSSHGTGSTEEQELSFHESDVPKCYRINSNIPEVFRECRKCGFVEPKKY